TGHQSRRSSRMGEFGNGTAEPGRVHHKGVIMSPHDYQSIQSRRRFFRNCAGGIGTAALAHLLQVEGRAAAPHFKPRAKNVIFLFMEGAPSQMDLFDPKPELERWHGKPLPESR